jgi:hypothetical protein
MLVEQNNIFNSNTQPQVIQVSTAHNHQRLQVGFVNILYRTRVCIFNMHYCVAEKNQEIKKPIINQF